MQNIHIKNDRDNKEYLLFDITDENIEKISKTNALSNRLEIAKIFKNIKFIQEIFNHKPVVSMINNFAI